MSDVVIRAEGLGKKYLIGHQANAERYTALRDVAARTAKGLLRTARDMLQGRQLVAGDEVEEFWALKDVVFEIRRGDVVGIIGRNGAGKSTLLKLLSRITEPSTGRVEIKGRVASLLEVGTGFHPELSGRENIYLNGAILGMSRAEIKRKFDEIVSFAEVERFLDTPVKHYSSGMYVRLAFAVAAHLEPEILIVDEVLAVGDAQFQKKCLGKMQDVAGQGRTVLFVSHNMGAIGRLCNKGLFLDRGSSSAIETIDSCIGWYFNNSKHNNTLTAELLSNSVDSHNNSTKLAINRIMIKTDSANPLTFIDNSCQSSLHVVFSVLIPGRNYCIAIELLNDQGTVIFSSSTLDLRPTSDLGDFTEVGEYIARVPLPVDWLPSGGYSIRVASTIPGVEVLHRFPKELHFTIHDSCSPIAVLGEGRRGLFVPRLQWAVTQSLLVAQQ